VGRLRIAVLNKIDVPDARELVTSSARRWRSGLRSTRSAPRTGEGLRELGFALARAVEEHRAALPEPEPCGSRSPPRRSTTAASPSSATRTTTARFVVRGAKPERWVRQTDFTNDEAVGFLADRLNRLGVEDALQEAGAQEGDAIVIGDVAFDFVPTLPAGTLERRGDRRARRAAAPTPASTPRTGCAPRSGWPPSGPAGCPTSSPRPGPTSDLPDGDDA
jgi:GTP-binding protein